MANKLHWITTSNELRSFLKGIGECLALDTESDHMYSYSPRVCLIQLAHEQETALVDPFLFNKTKIEPLLEVLSNPHIVKVMHSGHNDINELDRDFGVTINNFYDTQIAARFLGAAGAGLAWMLKEYFGVTAQKQFQKHDWTKRPVLKQACLYAAMDVNYLIEARKKQLVLLKKSDWFEPCMQQCAYVASNTFYQPVEFDQEGWAKIKGVEKLTHKSKRIFRDLYLLRHKLCLQENIPAYYAVSPHALLSIARTQPKNKKELLKTKGASSKPFLRKYCSQILNVISAAQTQRGIKLPKQIQQPFNGISISSELYDQIREWRNETAAQLGIPVPYIFSNSTLVDILRASPHTKEALLEIPGVLPWHVDRLGDQILSLLGAPKEVQLRDV